MCGIAGLMRVGPNAEPISIGQIQSLLVSLQHRGSDATGIALMNGNKIVVHKSPEIAWKYVTSRGFSDFIHDNLSDETRTCLLHTRAATIGLPEKNYNNHPMFNGQVAIVHNGHIGNHNELFQEYKLKRTAETDSDIIRAIVDEWGISRKALQKLDRMRGSCASAVIDPRTPKKLLLMRSGSPLVMAKLGSQIMWASEKKAIHLAARNWVRQWGMMWQANRADLVFNPMSHESAWILDEEEMITHATDPAWEPFHTEFSVTSNYQRPVYDVHARYEEKRKQKEAREAADKAERERKALPPAEEKKVAPEDGKQNSIGLWHNSKAQTESVTGKQWIPCQGCHVMCEVDDEAGNAPQDELVCSDCGHGLKISIN